MQRILRSTTFSFILLVLLALPSLAMAQNEDHKGREFFLVFLPNPIEPISLQLSILAETDTKVLVEYPVGTPLGDSLTVTAGENLVVAIPADAGRLNSWPGHFSLASDQNAIRVGAADEITCYLISRNDASSDGGLALPVEALQKNYVIAGYDISGQLDGDAGLFAVVAPFDSTLVTVTPVQNLVGGADAAKPLRIVLNRGEAFLAESAFGLSGAGVSLAGSFVKASKPVSVINGNKCTRVPLGHPSCDHLFEVAQPIQTWGRQIPVAAIGEATIRPAGAIYRILTSAPNTTVFLDGTPLGTISENRFLDTDTLKGSHVFSADQPIFVTQLMTSRVSPASNNADPAMTNMTPAEQFATTYAFSIPATEQHQPLFENNRITVIVHNDDIGLFSLDGDTISAQEFTAIPGSDFAVATLELQQQMLHRTASPNGHTVMVWGFSNDNSYMYPAGTQLAAINPLDDTPPEISIEFREAVTATAFGAVFDSKSGNIAGRDTLLYGGELSGIASIALADSQNVRMQAANFRPGDENATFQLTLIDRSQPGRATVTASDLSANSATRDVFIPASTVRINEPADGLVTVDPQIVVEAISGLKTLDGSDLSNFEKLDTLFVNDQIFTGAMLASDDSTFSATVPLQEGQNRIIAKRLFRHFGHAGDPALPVTSAADTIFVGRAAVFSCDELQIISPADSAIIDTAHIEVLLKNSISGGVPPTIRSISLTNLATQQTISLRDTLEVTQITDTTAATVQLASGWNRLIATLLFSDNANQTSACSDTIDIFRPEGFVCDVDIASPADSAFLRIGNASFSATFAASGGVQPYADTTGVFILDGDSIAAAVDASGTFSAELHVRDGANTVTARIELTDALGQRIFCEQTITVFGVQDFLCRAEISNLADGDFVTADSIEVQAIARATGGVLPVEHRQTLVIVNQDTAVFSNTADSLFAAVFPVVDGDNRIEILATFVDATGQETTCGERIDITKIEPLSCEVAILSPGDGAIVTSDSIDVVVSSSAIGGLAPIFASGSVNGVPVVLKSDTFSVRIPLTLGDNTISASCTFEDQAGQKTTCSATIRITREKGPLCEITVLEPADGAIVLTDSVLVTATRTISGGVAPFEEIYVINGEIVPIENDTLRLRVALVSDENPIRISSTITDSVGQQANCEALVTVIKPSAPACEITIIEPADGAVVASDSVLLVAALTVQGGMPPYALDATVNGLPVVLQNDTLAIRLPLNIGANPIEIAATVADSVGQVSSCARQISVTRPDIPMCSVVILQPEDSTITTADSIVVRARVAFSGGVQPYADSTFYFVVNDDTLRFAAMGDSVFSATVPLAAGRNGIFAEFAAVDAVGQTTSCRAMVSVFRAEPLACEVQILSPKDGELLISDSTRVTAVARVSGGIAPQLRRATINGSSAAARNDTLTANVPLVLGSNTIEVVAVFADLSGDSVVCTQTVQVSRELFTASVRILSPQDSSFVCEDSVQVSAVLEVTGGIAPIERTCELNGAEIEVASDSIASVLVVQSGWIDIILSCVITDAAGRSITASDTVTVLRDATPPTCVFEQDSVGDVYGTFSDSGSGIASFDIVDLENGRVFVEPFQPGAKVVKFQVDRRRSFKSLVFNIDVFDQCGNRFLCDPVFLRLDADAQQKIEFTFPAIDRYFYLTNRGLDEVHIELNGKAFTFATTAPPGKKPDNFFLMPADGTISLDLLPCLRNGENNMAVTFRGPPGTSANLVLMDIDNGVDFVLEYKEALPAAFQLQQNYPNPFNPETVIRFQLPVASDVNLSIYNVHGQFVRALVEGQIGAGSHAIIWDGRDQHGQQVASGVYLYQLRAGTVVQARKMALTR